MTECQCLLHNSNAGKLVHEFDPKVPVEKAVTPPNSWYTDPSFFQEELERVFYRGWQAVGLGVSNRWVWGGHNWVGYIKLIYPFT